MRGLARVTFLFTRWHGSCFQKFRPSQHNFTFVGTDVAWPPAGEVTFLFIRWHGPCMAGRGRLV